MTYGLTAIDYKVERGKPVLYLFSRDEALTRKVFKVDSFIPYYYYQDKVRGNYPVKGIDGFPATKVETQLPRDVSHLREGHQITYESDVLFPIRFLVDRGIRYGFDIKDGKVVPADYKGGAVLPLFLDIEVETPDPDIFPEPRIAKWMILCVSIWIPIEGNIAQWYFEITNEEEEEEFLRLFLDIVEEFDPDVFTAYNVFFDMGTIVNRMKHYQIDFTRLSPMSKVRIPDEYDEVLISGRNVFDYLPAYKKYKHRTLPSYNLKDVAEDEVGIPAEDFPLEKMNRHHTEEIGEYNSRDVLRMQMMEQKLQIIPFYDGIRQVVGCTYDEVMEAAKYVDVFLLRYAKGRFLLPRKPKGMKRLDYTGAIVLKPVKGVHRWVVLLDFTKMYPSILISYNISPETLRTAKPFEPHYTLPIGLKYKDEEGKPYVEWHEVYYLKEPAGFLSEVARDLIRLRSEVQKQAFALPRESPEYELLWHRQDALKVVLDAMYGVFAYPNFRLFQPYISASMTGQGQQLAKRTIQFIMDKFGAEALYTDTDGMYFAVDFNRYKMLKDLFTDDDHCDGLDTLLTIEIGKWMNASVNKFWEDIKGEYGLHMAPGTKLEHAFKSLMLAKKKRYSAEIICDNGVQCEPKIKIVGFETGRSDSAIVSVELQRALFKMIHQFDSNEIIVKFIESFAINAYNRSLQDIGIPLPLKTAITSMKNVARVKAIVYSNQYLKQKIEVGTRPLEYYIKTEKLFKDDKKAFGFPKKPILPEGLPTTFSLWTWSPKEEAFVTKYYIADRVAFQKAPPEEWRPYIDVPTQLEKVVYNKVDTILNALGVTEEDRIKLYGSKRPIKKEKVEEDAEEEIEEED
jgi:DNA polymerase elongation subunit (family B)